MHRTHQYPPQSQPRIIISLLPESEPQRCDSVFEAVEHRHSSAAKSLTQWSGSKAPQITRPRSHTPSRSSSGRDRRVSRSSPLLSSGPQRDSRYGSRSPLRRYDSYRPQQRSGRSSWRQHGRRYIDTYRLQQEECGIRDEAARSDDFKIKGAAARAGA